MKLQSWCLALAATPLLAACVNDSASFQNKEREISVTVIRQQRWLWDKTVDASVVVARMPDCQRRHPLDPIPPSARIELWQPGPGTFVLKMDSGMILTEVQTCEGWQPMQNPPAAGMGDPVGVFQEQGGKFKFIAAVEQGAPAAQ